MVPARRAAAKRPAKLDRVPEAGAPVPAAWPGIRNKSGIPARFVVPP
jgi:hypothetical protein